MGGPVTDMDSQANIVLIQGHSGRYVKWRELHEIERYYLWQEPPEFRDPPRVAAIKSAARQGT